MRRLPVFFLLLPLAFGAAIAKPKHQVEVEAPDDSPAPQAARDNPLARSPVRTVAQGPYQSFQVNVDSLGQNIVGDAANEPSIAVSPTNPANIVIGWRQFDSVASNFRQAGWAYSFDSGQTWTFPGTLQPGIFRSDPSLDTDLQGNFYYQSLKGDTFTADVWRSTNGGVSWMAPVSEFGGDKNWFVVDKSGGASSGFLYGIWQRFTSCCGTNVLTRSTNGGASFQSPVSVATWPTFGILAVGPSGELYSAGVDGTVTQDFAHFVVAKSTNASNPTVTPTFTGKRVNLAGGMLLGAAPNPEGLMGQGEIAVDRSSGLTKGYVYLAASVTGADPVDAMLSRSTDGGNTWSAPVRINDDPSQSNWQWFTAHSVAPNGRIDVVWNDSRNTGQSNLVQLYYAYSLDAGVTWSPNVAVSPVFDSTLGYPDQNKMGDYIGIVSAATGADVAYTATFNGEQDVYYVRVFPDCNGNGISDVTDVANQTSADCNGDSVPDECQQGIICGPSLAYASSTLTDTCAAGGTGSANGAVDPGEDVALSVALKNDGGVTLTGVTATLSTTTPGVTVTRANATFPSIPTRATASSNAPGYAFTVDASAACGTPIAFTLNATTGQGSFTRTFSVRIGLPAFSTSTFASSDVPKPIVDLSTTTSTLVVPPGANLADLDVGVTLNQSYDADLVIVLVGPDGRRSLLSYGEGDAGQNYTGTVFDDEAPQDIETATAPFTGHFRPRQPLSSFDGTPSAGTWTLEVQNIGSGDTGSLNAWSLTPGFANGFTCNVCSVTAPTLEALNLRYTNKTTLAWSAVTGGSFYDIFRGAGPDLPNLLGPATDSCLRLTTTSTAASVNDTVPDSTLYWYLVRAGNGAGLGPAGSATAGPRSQDSTGACP
ncbi:MAG TPA: proprotein convertase P-domain-containing protein [Candidatus Polarisedimenticolaceae bacterium]|nr:proprotein convertase P-domain-containing protein [Candidatus Polarisedimenticolaceae bacterium]